MNRNKLALGNVSTNVVHIYKDDSFKKFCIDNRFSKSRVNLLLSVLVL